MAVHNTTRRPKRRPWIELTQARQAAGMNASALADAARISKAYVSYLESGDREPSDEVILKLAAVLAVPTRQLRPDRGPLLHGRSAVRTLLRELPAECHPEIHLEPADYQLPDCDHCQTLRIGRARISWEPRDETSARSLSVCTACLPDVAQTAVAEGFDDAPVLVEITITGSRSRARSGKGGAAA